MKFNEDFLQLLIQGIFVNSNEGWTTFRIQAVRNKSFCLMLDTILTQSSLKLNGEFDLIWDDPNVLDLYFNVEKNGRVYQAMLPIKAVDFNNPIKYLLVFDKGGGNPTEYNIGSIYG